MGSVTTSDPSGNGSTPIARFAPSLQEMADEAIDLMTPEEDLAFVDAQRRELDGQIFSIGEAWVKTYSWRKRTSGIAKTWIVGNCTTV